MTKPRRWKLSPGSGALLLAFLLLPLVFQLLWLVARRGLAAWSDFVGLACALSLGGLVWLISLRPLCKERTWRSAQTWYQASFALSALYVIYALWIFVTGTTPGKTGGRPISREYGFTWLGFAALPLVVGAIAYLIHKQKAPNQTAEPMRARGPHGSS